MDKLKTKLKQYYRGNKKTVKLTTFVVSGAVIIVFVFIVGINVGDGEIQFNNGHLIQIGDSGGSNGLAPKLNYAAIQQEYNAIKNNYDGKLTTQQLQDGVQNALAASTGDPHTEYFTNSEATAFNNELNNTFSGIGAELDTNSSKQIEIIAPLAGTPADKAGLKSHDIITSINGQSTSGMSVETAVDKIHGASGTKVTLGVSRDGNNLSFRITRANIVVPSVTEKIIDGDIGYMQISSFADDTSSLALQAANTFNKDNVKGVILDLRDNPGGLVTAAINVSSLWVPNSETIMTEKHNNQIVQTYQSLDTDVLTSMPTVVLINDGSASASEITAAALRDNSQAKLIGTRSYGKGSVQEIMNLQNGSEIKVTIYHWYTPDNKNIDKVGLTPDITVNESSSDLNNGIDDQLNRAVQYIQTGH